MELGPAAIKQCVFGWDASSTKQKQHSRVKPAEAGERRATGSVSKQDDTRYPGCVPVGFGHGLAPAWVVARVSMPMPRVGVWLRSGDYFSCCRWRSGRSHIDRCELRRACAGVSALRKVAERSCRIPPNWKSGLSSSRHPPCETIYLLHSLNNTCVTFGSVRYVIIYSLHNYLLLIIRTSITIVHI